MKIFQKKKPRPLFIGCRVSEEEYVLIVEAAERAGVGLSYFYREVLLGHPKLEGTVKNQNHPRRGCSLPRSSAGETGDSRTAPKDWHQPQPDRACHEHAEIPHPPELVQVLKEILRYLAFVRETEGKALTEL